MRLSLFPLIAALALPACDTQYDNGYDDGFFDGQANGQNNASNGATFVDFSLDALDYQISGDERTATYETDSIDEDETRARVGRALARAGDGALVMLYIRSNLVNVAGNGESTPYTALPISRGFEEFVFADIDADGDGNADVIPVVGYTASYEFSFDNQDLFFDVVSSTSASNFPGDPRVLFDYITPQLRAEDGLPSGRADRLRFRLVTVPATAGNKTAIDMTNYAAVRAAYNLPD